MKDRKLATRYARALLSVLGDTPVAATADAFLTSLARSMDSSVELRVALLNPAVPRPVRKKALHALSEHAGAGPVVGKFLSTIVDNRRVADIPSIAAAFHEVRESAAGVVPATITTARPIDPQLQARVGGALERLTGRKIRATWQVDESLVGGVVSRIGSKVYDGSVRTQLASLRRRMAEGVVNP